MGANKFNSIIDEIVPLYHSGYKINNIAEILNLKVNQVKYILYRKIKIHEDQPRKIFGDNIMNLMPKYQVSRCLTLAKYGYGKHTIAKDQGIPVERVSRLIQEALQKKII